MRTWVKIWVETWAETWVENWVENWVETHEETRLCMCEDFWVIANDACINRKMLYNKCIAIQQLVQANQMQLMIVG